VEWSEVRERGERREVRGERREGEERERRVLTCIKQTCAIIER